MFRDDDNKLDIALERMIDAAQVEIENEKAATNFDATADAAGAVMVNATVPTYIRTIDAAQDVMRAVYTDDETKAIRDDKIAANMTHDEPEADDDSSDE